MWMCPPYTTVIFPILPGCSVWEMSVRRNRKLVQVTKECVELGLAEVKPWGFLGDVGAAICEQPMPRLTRWWR